MDLGKQLDIFVEIYGINVDTHVDKNTPDNSFKGRYKIEHCKSLQLFHLNWIFDGELWYNNIVLLFTESCRILESWRVDKMTNIQIPSHWNEIRIYLFTSDGQYLLIFNQKLAIASIHEVGWDSEHWSNLFIIEGWKNGLKVPYQDGKKDGETNGNHIHLYIKFIHSKLLLYLKVKMIIILIAIKMETWYLE